MGTNNRERIFSVNGIDAEIAWTFDNSLQDAYNSYNGVANGGPTYQSPSYSGVGTCLKLDQSLHQSVTINSPPFLDMANTSFTFEVWMYANSLNNGTPYSDNYLVGQFEQRLPDHALHIMIRNQKAYLGFFSDDAVSNQVSKHQILVEIKN